MGVGRPCLPVRNDIVTPRHLQDNDSKSFENIHKLNKALYSAAQGWVGAMMEKAK